MDKEKVTLQRACHACPCRASTVHNTRRRRVDSQVSVHRGFMGAYQSVRRQLSSLLHAITVSAGAGGPWTINVTGHSLGGALATLAAYELASYK